jgi:hypothetical protein
MEQSMRNWGFLPSPGELAKVTAALQSFRERWASIRPPFPAAFDGTIADVHALDYMNYEGINFPLAGIEGSALVCGEVVRRAAGLEWVISYRGDWFIASPEESWPTVALCPLARLHEIECGGAPQFGMHLWFVQKAAFECLLLCGPERQPIIRELLDGDGDYLEWVEKTLESLRRSSRSEPHSAQGYRRPRKKKRRN